MKQTIIRLDIDENISEPEIADRLDQELRSAADLHSKYRSVLLHVYTGFTEEHIISSVTAELKKFYADAVIAGTLSAGEIAHGSMVEKCVLISVMLFEESDIRLSRYDQVDGHETEIGAAICRMLDEITDIKAAELLLTGTEFDTRILFEEISKCRKDISIFGGYSGGHELVGGEHLVFDSEGIYRNSILVLTYAGKDLQIDIDKSVGWQQIGTPLKVTKADRNRLIEVDGKPAAEVYEKYLEISKNKNFAEETFEFPLMAKVKGEELLRHTSFVEEDGTLRLTGYVTEGMEIYLSYGDPSEIIGKVNDRLKALQEFSPQAQLLYSCCVRKIFWKEFVNIEMMPFEQYAPTAGFHTWGEIMRSPKSHDILEYNITLLSIAMREGKSAKTPPRAIVDDTLLKGQASLVKRLARLIYITTGELMKAYEDISRMNKTLRIIAEHDGLTTLYNRSMIENMIEDELDRSRASGRKTTLIMLDIDHFKNVNDTYGHGTGDKVLKKLAKLMLDISKEIPGAAAGRWGGEEFFIMLPDTDEELAYQFAEQLRGKVDHENFEEVGHVTISIGVITVSQLKDYKKVYTKVDDALYRAKETGRNRIVVAEN